MAAELQGPIVVIDDGNSDDNATAKTGGRDSRESNKDDSNAEMEIAEFVMKLYKMVEAKDAARTKCLVRWSSTGTSFIVTDPNLFATDVLPIFFKYNKLPSFTRQLNYFATATLSLDLCLCSSSRFVLQIRNSAIFIS